MRVDDRFAGAASCCCTGTASTASGGGFGNTVQLEDGNLVSVYSYRREDMKTYIEAVRWSLPATK